MNHRGHKTTVNSQKEWDCLEITNYKIQITNKLQITNKKGKLHGSNRIDSSTKFFCLFSVLSVAKKRRKKWH